MTAAADQSWAFALAVITVVAVLIWAVGSAIIRNLTAPRPAARNRDEADMARQIATLRRSADKAVASRPRVRATSLPVASAVATESTGKVWLRGVCCHEADCPDVHCPGRLQAQLDAMTPKAAKVAICRQKTASASVKRSSVATQSVAKTGT